MSFSRYGEVDEDEALFMLDAMIRYDKVNTSHDFFKNPFDADPADLLKIFKSVQCSDSQIWQWILLFF